MRTALGLSSVLALLLSSAADAAPTGGVRATVRLAGPVPEPKTIEPTTDVAICGQQGLVDESILADPKTRALRNVVAWIEGTKAPAPSSPPIIDNYRCRYEPHVVVVPAGAEVVVRNRDRFLHTSQAKAPDGRLAFNVALPNKDQEIKRSFKEPGPHALACDVHTWMSGWALVTKGELAAVSDEAGLIRIDGVPPGRYTMRLWHEELGAKAVEIEVAGGRVAEVELSFGKE